MLKQYLRDKMTLEEVQSRHENINNELYLLNVRENELYKQLENIKENRYRFNLEVKQLVTYADNLKKKLIKNVRI